MVVMAVMVILLLMGLMKKVGRLEDYQRPGGAGPHCLPSSAGNNNQYRLAWQPTKNTKEIISLGRTHKLYS